MAEACTCTIRNHGRVIEFCPMHKAAPELLAALKALGDSVLPGRPKERERLIETAWIAAQGAIAQARGQEVKA